MHAAAERSPSLIWLIRVMRSWVLELESYAETESPGAGLHEVVESLVIGSGRSGDFGIEGRLVVDHPQVASHERYGHAHLVVEPLRREVVADREFAQPHVGHVIDVVREHRHAVSVVGVEGLHVGQLLVLRDPYAAVVAGVGRSLRGAPAVQQGLRGRYALAADARVDQHAERYALVGELVVPSQAEARFGVAAVDPRVGIGRDGIRVGQLSCFLSYANQYTKPFNEISGVVTELQNAIACAGRVLELIEETPEIPDSEDAIKLGKADGKVEIEDVYFSYEPNQKLIEHFNLQVKPGQRVAIVGPTGCGKTTLINLLMRFYDVNSGAIKVSEKDIRKVTRESLRANYGMVLQETWLKQGTIRENIVMGRENATDDEVLAAAKASHAHSFIKRLPNGYDTVIGEDGGSLSAGQKQLLCITRVMLCLPPMLILDEATSSIDTRTEMRIQKAFATMMQGRTSFLVAHRLSTIQEADVILVMRDGKIVEQGNHEELLAANGFYKNLFDAQWS